MLFSTPVASVKWRGFSQTTRIHEAREVLLSRSLFNPEVENIPVLESYQRVLADDVVAPVNLPGFKRSAMDGYAVVSSDTHAASDTSPKLLQLVGKVDIGDTDVKHIEPGEVMEIATGAPLPKGADAVVKVEDTERIGDTVEIYVSVPQGRNVAQEDEDVKKGTVVFKKGRLLSLIDVSLLVSMGVQQIPLFCKPRILLLSTGNELIPLGEEVQIGQVHDSNRPALELWLKRMGGEVIISKSCSDDPDVIKQELLSALPQTDLIVTTGGTSVGTKDYMEEVVSSLGSIWVHGVSIRPGKPVILGEINDSGRSVPIIALPGYPLAAFLNFENLVVPLLSKWTGIHVPVIFEKVKLNHRIPSKEGIRDFVRLRKAGIDGDGLQTVDLVRITGAGILSSLANADYILEVPEDIEGYNSGDIVQVRKLGYNLY